jgi:signal transduction histidine kinase
VFYYDRKLEKQKIILEKQQLVEQERTRIATDMHDDLGAGLSRIKFLSETVNIKSQQEKTIKEDIIKIKEYSDEMISKMGEIVWALNEKNDSVKDLLAYTRAYAAEYLLQNEIKSKIITPEIIPDLFVSGEFRRNIYLTVKEALHNVVKHAHATEVIINIQISQLLTIVLHDNGIGFDAENIRPFSNGLTNMKKRIKDINGELGIKKESGTELKVIVPLTR